MKGLYVNVPGGAERALDLLRPLGARYEVARASRAAGELAVVYQREEWPSGPVVSDAASGAFAMASGWLVFRGVPGDLGGLVRALAAAPTAQARHDVLAGIDGGAFVVLVEIGGEVAIVTDPFGLHAHYRLEEERRFVVAPSPLFLREGTEASPQRARMLAVNNHLFGNLTAYEKLERLEPGAVVGVGGCEHYARYVPPAEVAPLDELRRVAAWFSERKRLLPLSGGLDSRLLLAAAERFDHGYTYGPADTGDRPVARRFAHRFGDYRELSLLDVEYPAAVRETCRAMFDGVIARPFTELLAVYRDAYHRYGACAAFDGYLGDVLQRGLYLTHGGVRGALAKALPPLTLRGFEPERFLRRKYASLAPADFEVVAELFREKTARFDVDPPHRVVLFDVLYGRGARYVTGGGTVMAGQLFTPVQPFATPRLFSRLFATPARSWLSYRSVRELWRDVPAELASVRTYSGFVPTWPGDVSRLVMLATKGGAKALARLGIASRASSYEDELPKVVWR